MQFRLFGLVIVALGIVACGRTPVFEPVEGADITVIATELDGDTWRIDFHLPNPERIVFFSRSNGDYRQDTWVPLGQAPTLERIGGFDALLFDEPTAEFSYEITPRTKHIPKDYTPYLAFSDGGKAVYTGQFELLTVATREELETLSGDLSKWRGDQWQLGVRIKSDRPMLMQGERFVDQVDQIVTGGGTYVYVGESELVEGDSYVGVVDNQLPSHIRDTFDDDLAVLFEIYEARWGFVLPSKTTLYYAFDGYEHSGSSHAGSVIGTDLMVLQSSGTALMQPDSDARTRSLWFFAHEVAHMFQNTVRNNMISGSDAWIHEGGANVMANSVIRAMPGVSDSLVISEYKKAFDECAKALSKGSLVSAHLDGRFYAHYTCGQIFNAAVDSALDDHDLYDFWKAYSAWIETENSNQRDAYFETLETLGADPSVVQLIQQLAYEDQSDPQGRLADLMGQSGLEPSFDEDGALLSVSVPR